MTFTALIYLYMGVGGFRVGRILKLNTMNQCSLLQTNKTTEDFIIILKLNQFWNLLSGLAACFGWCVYSHINNVFVCNCNKKYYKVIVTCVSFLYNITFFIIDLANKNILLHESFHFKIMEASSFSCNCMLHTTTQIQLLPFQIVKF